MFKVDVVASPDQGSIRALPHSLAYPRQGDIAISALALAAAAALGFVASQLPFGWLQDFPLLLPASVILVAFASIYLLLISVWRKRARLAHQTFWAGHAEIAPGLEHVIDLDASTMWTQDRARLQADLFAFCEAAPVDRTQDAFDAIWDQIRVEHRRQVGPTRRSA